MGAIREYYPTVSVIIKPITTDMDIKIKHITIDRSHKNPTVIEDQIKPKRIGAFEV
jgi:hypothetical protein